MFFYDEIFAVEPLSGRIWAKSKIAITFTFTPKAPESPLLSKLVIEVMASTWFATQTPSGVDVGCWLILVAGGTWDMSRPH